MKQKLRIKAKSYKIVNDLTEKELAQYGITRDQIDMVVDHTFECVREFMYQPIKGRIFIDEFGSFVIKTNAVIKYLKGRIETFKRMKKKGEEIPEEWKEKFRYWWSKRIMAVRFAANDKMYIKGFYKPKHILTNKLISKKK